MERHEALMRITIKQAGEATGKSKATILRAIKDSKISAEKDDTSGSWLIEESELYRVFKPASNDAGEALHGDAAMLRREVAAMQRQLDDFQHERERERLDKDRQIDSLTRRLEAAEEERRTTLRQLTALLTDQREQPARRGWWPFGRRRG
jgi:predicted RNase H-like nuclease (RuvC/YqgF family)